MMQWYRKALGFGPAMFQDLREIRTLRYEHDRRFDEASLFQVVLELESERLFLYLPPGNADFASVCQAEPCSAPDLDAGTHFLRSIEYHPAQKPSLTSKQNGSVGIEYSFSEPSPNVLNTGMD